MVITKPRNLAHATKDEIRSFIDAFDNIYFDCDGVLMNGVNVIPGVTETIQRLRCLGKRMKVITNNTFRTDAQWEEMLVQNRMNFELDDIIYPTKVVIDFFKKINYKKKVYVLGTKIFKDKLLEAGIQIMEFDGEEKIEDIDTALDKIPDDLDVGAVVVEFDFNLNYAKLLKATVLLNRPEVHFLCCGKDKKYHIKSNINVLGSYYCVNGLETVINRNSIVCGKPGPLLQSYLTNTVAFAPERTLFVGDSMESDMKFASVCGFQPLLVLSGITKLADLDKGLYSEMPKYYIDSLGTLCALIENLH